MSNTIQDYDPNEGWASIDDDGNRKPKPKRSTAAYDRYDGFTQAEIASLATQPTQGEVSGEEQAAQLRQQIAENGGLWPFVELADIDTGEILTTTMIKGEWGDYYAVYRDGFRVGSVGYNVKDVTMAKKGYKRVTINQPAKVELRDTAIKGKREAVVVKANQAIPASAGLVGAWQNMRNEAEVGLI